MMMMMMMMMIVVIIVTIYMPSVLTKFVCSFLERESSDDDMSIPSEEACASAKPTQGLPTDTNPFSEPWEDSDLVLVVESGKFHVHRLVLILNSPVFKAMLKSDFKEAKSAEIPRPQKDPIEVLNLIKQLYPQVRSEITSMY